MKRSLVLSATFFCSTMLFAVHEAHAAERGWYAGAAFSSISPDYFRESVAVIGTAADSPSRYTGQDLDSIGPHGLKLVAGYRAFGWLAFEADYLGPSGDSAPLEVVCATAPCPNRIRAQTSNASLSALLLWPLEKFDLFARAGVTRWKFRVETLADGATYWSQDLSDTDQKFGAGAQVHIKKITARLEYERLRFGRDAADSWSLGLAWSFR